MKDEQIKYARDREWRRLEYLKKQDEFIVNDIQSNLSSILYDISKEANNWYLKYADQNGITVAGAQKVAEIADVKYLEAQAKKYVQQRWKKDDQETPFTKKANEEMAAYNFTMKISRHDLLKRYVEMAFVEGYQGIDNKLVQHLTGMTVEELNRQAVLLGKAVKTPEELLRDAEIIAKSSFHDATFSERLWKQQEVLQKYLNNGITQSILMGKHPTAWMGALQPFLNNAQKNGNYALQRLAVTESGRVQIEAQKASYEQYGYDEYIVICEPTACPICLKFDGEHLLTKDMVIGENAPMFHPNCRCSTAAYMDRRELERSFAEYEKGKGLTEEERFQNILESVQHNQEALTRANVPKGMQMLDKSINNAHDKERTSGLKKETTGDIEEKIEKLGARTDIFSEKIRVNLYGSSWQVLSLKTTINRLGGDLKRAYLNKSGTKVIIPTTYSEMNIIYSPSGKYYRIHNPKFDFRDRNGYYDIDGDKGVDLRNKIRKDRSTKGLPISQKAEVTEIEERTHFRDE